MTILKQVPLVLGLGLLIGCSGLEGTNNTYPATEENLSSDNGALNGVGAESVDIFSQTVHPILSQNCAACHGAGQAPLHSVADVQSSHDTVLQFNLVDLQSPANSRLVTKIQEGHNGFATSVADELEAAIGSWIEQLDAIGGTTDLPAPLPLEATFKSISQNILLPKCAGCHGGAQPEEGISLDSYAGTLAIVNINNPAASELYTQTDPEEEDDVMPPAPAPNLTPEERSTLLTWIENGALDN